MGGEGVTGTLKYIADYSDAGFSGEEASGNFLALHASVPGLEGATITAQVINGVHGPVTLDTDGCIVVRIADKSTQKVQFTASYTGFDDVITTLDLTGLTVNNA